MKNSDWLVHVVVAISAIGFFAACQCNDESTLSGEAPKVVFDNTGPQPCLKADASDLTPCTTGVVNFGKVPVNTSVQQTLTITNTGNAALEFKDFTIKYTGGKTTNAFAEGSKPETIQPNKDGKYVMAYTPKAVGQDAGTLRIEAYINKLMDQVEIYDFTLVGEGVEAAIDVCVLDDKGNETKCESQCDKDAKGKPTDCLQVAFGEVNLATQTGAVTRQVVVKNNGGMALLVDSTPVLECPVTKPSCQVADMTAAMEYSVTDPSTGTPKLPGMNEVLLQPGGKQVVTLAYKPYDGGEDSGVFQVVSEDQVSSTINVYLGGTGKAPKICPDPVTVDFGTVDIGQSMQKTVALKSCGTDPLELKGVTLVNSASNWYTLDSVTPNAPITLNPGDVVTVAVSCKPDKVTSETGQLNVVTNDPSLKDGTGYIRLLCQGREPPACKIKADPTTLDYGKMAANKVVTKDFYVLNVGEQTCTVSALSGPTNTAAYKTKAIADDAGKAISGTPFTIDPTKRVKVTMQFTAPSDKSCPSDKVTVVNDSVNAPNLDVTLTGCGGEASVCKFAVTPTGTLNFGNVAKGAKKTMGINFDNTGTDDCQITASKFGLQTGTWFSFAQKYNYPIVVPPGSTSKVEVVCSPKDVGPATDKYGFPDMFGTENNVNTTTSDPAQPAAGTVCTSAGWCHKLSCTGVLSKLDVLPNPIDFGLVTIGCNSQEVVVKLYNNGTATLNVTQLEVVPAGNVFIISSQPPGAFTIGANSSVQIKMKYHPSKSGIETGVLRIHTDAPNANNGLLDVPLKGEGTTVKDVKDVFKQTDKPTVDVLWCVDNSGSMSDDQTALSSNFPQFINYAVSLNIDYQMGVVTAEINEAGKGDTGDMIYPGVLFQHSGDPRIITNSNPHPTTPPYVPTNVNPVTAFQANAMPGGCCADEQESCMEAVHMALSDPLINDDQANKGFLRQYARLVVIMMSDEEDQSPGAVDYYVDFLKQLKGPRNKDLLSTSIITGVDRDGDVKNPPNATGCGGSSSGSGADPAVRYLDMFKKIGNGLAFSICNADWGTNMQKLGLDAFVAVIEYYLSRQADPTTIKVTVNGNSVSNDPVNGYSYDPNTNSIVFGSGAVPPKGATIEVDYSAQCY